MSIWSRVFHYMLRLMGALSIVVVVAIGFALGYAAYWGISNLFGPSYDDDPTGGAVVFGLIGAVLGIVPGIVFFLTGTLSLED